MMLLRLITWPYVRRHLLRCTLTTAGIVLGVAVFVGMHAANQSVLYAFNQTVDRIAGQTQLQITAGETGFDEAVLERVQSHPAVEAAVPVIEAAVQTGIAGQGNLLVLGVDMTGDRALRDYDLDSADEAIIDDPLVFIAQPDSILVSRAFLDRTGLRLNSALTMKTMQGEKRFVIRGVMKGSGLASAFGGNLAVMDIYSAQMVFGRGRKFDRIDLTLRRDVPLETGKQRLQQYLGAGLLVDSPASRGQQFEAMSQVYSLSANVTSLFALFIGLFLIYNTFSIAVNQRRSEIGVLRALGASARQVQGLFLIESAIAGLFGSLAGIVAGVFIARALAAYLSGMFSEIYGVAQRAGEVSADPGLLGAALAIGILTSILAGWLPARDAARVDPVKALQKGRVQVLSEGENRIRRYAALATLAAGIACVALGHRPAFFYTGYLLSVLAAVLMAPALCVWLTRLLRPALKWARPVEGALAADSLLQAPRRTSATVAALSLSLALVVGLAGIAKASYESIRVWMDQALNPDFFITCSESITERSFRFEESLGAEIRQVPGIAEVQPVRTARIVYQGTPVMLVAADTERISQRVKMRVVEGDASTMYARVSRGEGVVLSDNFAQLRRMHAGDPIVLLSPTGPVRTRVLGIVLDYSDQQGTILMDRRFFASHWNDTSVNVFRVYLHEGAARAEVRDELLRRFGGRTRFFVLTNDELKAFILKVTDQWFGLSYIQIFVAIIVAILGIVNTLTVSIADRRRELGVLQAVGGLRSQIRHTIWLEAASIGILGLIIGYALGGAQLYYILEITRRDVAGLSLDYRYPIEIAAILVPIIIGSAFLAALGPAEGAVRGSLVEALEYE
jgi:putative ABC transport system permease protein